MNLIWAFEIKKVDGDGPLDPEKPAFVDAAIRYVRSLVPTVIDFNLFSPSSPPKPFNCVFRDRRR